MTTTGPRSVRGAGGTDADADADDVVVHLVDGPFVTVGGARRDLPECASVLLVRLVRTGAGLDRARLAGELWPGCGARRATGNLRTTLWRLQQVAPGLVDVGRRTLRLGAHARVDVDDVVAEADRVATGAAPLAEALGAVPRLLRASSGLLPGWEDAEVLVDRAWLRQHVIRAYERAARALLADGQPTAAAEVAAALTHAEPLRETAQRLLIEALLAEGNWVEARRALDDHRHVLACELGVPVDPALELLVTARPVSGDRPRA